MEFGETGRKKNIWKEEPKGKVKSSYWLGYILCESNNDNEQVKTLVVMSVGETVWKLLEKKISKTLVRNIVLYGLEVREWRE